MEGICKYLVSVGARWAFVLAKSLTLEIDALSVANPAHQEKYGAQPPIELLRLSCALSARSLL